MTRQTFLRQLPRAKKLGKVSILFTNVIRIYSNDGMVTYCPITAVGQIVTGKRYDSIGFYIDAGEDLGLSEKDIKEIVMATDLSPGYNKRLRDAILRRLS